MGQCSGNLDRKEAPMVPEGVTGPQFALFCFVSLTCLAAVFFGIVCGVATNDDVGHKTKHKDKVGFG
jgi:hypothetical protein